MRESVETKTISETMATALMAESGEAAAVGAHMMAAPTKTTIIPAGMTSASQRETSPEGEEVSTGSGVNTMIATNAVNAIEIAK
jgi:hypothetical protein